MGHSTPFWQLCRSSPYSSKAAHSRQKESREPISLGKGHSSPSCGETPLTGLSLSGQDPGSFTPALSSSLQAWVSQMSSCTQKAKPGAWVPGAGLGHPESTLGSRLLERASSPDLQVFPIPRSLPPSSPLHD